jgi:transcription elongation factor Elf1
MKNSEIEAKIVYLVRSLDEIERAMDRIISQFRRFPCPHCKHETLAIVSVDDPKKVTFQCLVCGESFVKVEETVYKPIKES